MNTTCMPSQVMREGNDLNQQGHAARQEQASSSSPESFQDGLASALSEAWHTSNVPRTPRIIPAVRCLNVLIRVIGFFLSELTMVRCDIRFEMDCQNVIAVAGTQVKNKSERQIRNHRQMIRGDAGLFVFGHQNPVHHKMVRQENKIETRDGHG